MVIKSIVGNLRLSLPRLTHFPTKVDSSDLKIGGFLDGCWQLMRTLRGHKRNRTAIRKERGKFPRWCGLPFTYHS